jgi:GTP-binding protein EngB required for normal cell division
MYILHVKYNYTKMWGRKSITTEISNFFEGFNITSHMLTSVYGKLMKVIDNAFTPDEINEYKLPRVIVIGNESSGKSSLLENITKCQLFPRDSKICTKCPIFVKMKSGDKSSYIVRYNINSKQKETVLKEKKEIYDVIATYMKTLPDDAILDSEIIIDIIDKDMHDFEFLDLPGIRAYPPEMANKSIEICKKYLKDQNSIILCVVPASTTRLTACQSIALINEMKLEKNSIIALTMCDRLQPSNIEELLINRIINKSDELKGLGKFAGCIGIVNRTHDDTYTLVENDSREKKWFTENILINIPNEFLKHKNTIVKNITIPHLVTQMDKLYNVFFHTDWKPRMLKTLENKINSEKNDLEKMGPLPVDAILLNEYLNNIITSYFDKLTYEYELPKLLDIKSKKDIYLNYDILIDWTNKMICSKIDILNPIKSYIDENFTNENKYILIRFLRVKQLLVSSIENKYKELCQRFNEHIIVEIYEKISYIIMDLGTISEQSVKEISNSLYRLHTLYITYPLLIKTHHAIFNANDFIESVEYNIKRLNIIDNIEKFKRHFDCVNKLKM